MNRRRSKFDQAGPAGVTTDGKLVKSGETDVSLADHLITTATAPPPPMAGCQGIQTGATVGHVPPKRPRGGRGGCLGGVGCVMGGGVGGGLFTQPGVNK